MSKAQGIVELGLIVAVVALIAVVAFTPIGTKIKNYLDHMSPQKNVTISSEVLDKITGNATNSTTLTNGLVQLQNSDNTSSQEAASFINSVLEIASIVSSGQNSSLSNEKVETIANSMKKAGTAETSGSLASMVAANVEGSAFSTSDKTTLSQIENLLSTSEISVDTSSEKLTSSIKTFVSVLSAAKYGDVSPVNSSTPAGIINGVLMAIDITGSSSATAEIKKSAQTVINSFKTALSLN
ncbi:MAG: hypothetical protein WC197_00365 [Candidatus Gastranaerophilaceae bacterium]|jgi:hypothetical protein